MKARDSLYHFDVRKLFDKRVFENGMDAAFRIRFRFLLVEHGVWSFGQGGPDLRQDRAEVLSNTLNIAMQIAGIVFGSSALSRSCTDAENVKHACHAVEKSASERMSRRWSQSSAPV